MGKWIVALLMLVLASQAGGVVLEFDDPLAERQWYHGRMRFGEAWGHIYEQPRRGQITVAVLDSGFQADHMDLRRNLLGGINIVDGTSNIASVHPHGTGTAGIPGASSGNHNGISQSAWMANVLPVRITNRPDAAAYVSDIAAGIRFATDSGARVINISYGGAGHKVIAVAAKYAYKRGALVFMAAGNNGLPNRWKNYKQIVAVGSIDETDRRSDFSTYGRFIDFVAPGENVTTLYTEDGTAEWNGTSFSSPIAASVAALMLTANPELSSKQVLKILKKTADPLGEGLSRRHRRREYGYGLPDALAAIEMSLATKGRLRRKLKRSGIDPWVTNDINDFSGLLNDAMASGLTEALGIPAALSALVEPQGFVTYAEPGSPAAVPEPGVLTVLIVALLVMLRRSRRAAITAG